MGMTRMKLIQEIRNLEDPTPTAFDILKTFDNEHLYKYLKFLKKGNRIQVSDFANDIRSTSIMNSLVKNSDKNYLPIKLRKDGQ